MATVVVAQPTTTTTEAPTATTVGAVGEHVHGELVSEGEVCHTHDGTVAEHCHTVEYPSTTTPDPAASGDCPGNYHQWYKVRDDCVISEVAKELLAFQAGSHTQRMAAIRDGHLLAGVFAELQVATEQYFGKDAANDLAEVTSLWADADNQAAGPSRYTGRSGYNLTLSMCAAAPTAETEATTPDVWTVVPFTFIDSQWKISYQGFCRLIDGSIGFVEAAGGTLSRCPPDPRPGLVKMGGSGGVLRPDRRPHPPSTPPHPRLVGRTPRGTTVP